jgi:tryptophan 2,3-dioxygenase
MTQPSGHDYDPAGEGAEMRFAERMSYSDYLHLQTLFNAQRPISTAHDEMLFIIQHQTSELWLKLIVHELTAARAALKANDLAPVLKVLARVARIFEQLNSAWDVLRTMTPTEYTEFRHRLGQSSGFQSWQYRQIEYMLGNRNKAMLKPHEHVSSYHQQLAAELTVPSFYDEVLHFADRHGLKMPQAVLSRDVTESWRFDEGVMAAWKTVYLAPRDHWQLYDLAEKLVDLEDYFRRWRFNHVTTVERVIGFKRGTGGTGGVTYLKRMLEIELFPELWRVRTEL